MWIMHHIFHTNIIINTFEIRLNMFLHTHYPAPTQKVKQHHPVIR